MKISEITAYLESIAPSYLQESYDNSGLITGHPQTGVTGILFCLDAIESIIDEAISKGCNLVVAHHPIVFRGLKRFNGNNYVERTIIKAIQHNIAIYAIHTNLDNVLQNGVNGQIASRLKVTNLRILAPKNNDPETGAGVVGELAHPMEGTAFLEFLKQQMNTRCVRHTALLQRPIKKVAVCGGAGSFLLPQAIAAGADIFVTADFKYHEFFDAESRIIIADIGHYESEQFTINLLHALICEKFPNFALHLTGQNTNPVNYY